MATATTTPSAPSIAAGPLATASRHSGGAGRWWALAGAGFLVLQGYVYSAWLSAGWPATIGTGADPVPTAVKVWAWITQSLVPILFLVCIVYTVRRSRREGKICFDALLLIGWFLVYWQDPMPVMLRRGFFYNSYLVNVSSWAPYIPGWLSPDADRMPAPLLLTSVLFPVLGLGTAVVIGKVMHWSHRRMAASRGTLVVIAILSGMLIDLIVESALVRTELDSYAGAVRTLSFWPDSRYRFPVYEAVLMGTVWGIAAAVRYFVDDQGRSSVERSIAQMPGLGRARAVVQILAVAGYLNVLFLLYASVFNWLSLYGGPVPADLPSYLRNGICGTGIEGPCPEPHATIPVGGPFHAR